MLTDHQITNVWEHLLAAETRALYFGDLTSRYTTQKQWITGGSFFLSSGAAAAIIAKAPPAFPAILALLVAAATAYAMAVNLDGRIRILAQLQSSWSQIAARYDSLWSHLYDDAAEAELQALIDREREPSQLAALSAPYNEHLLRKWQDRVFAMHHLPSAA
jgi:hypothetical protein